MWDVTNLSEGRKVESKLKQKIQGLSESARLTHQTVRVNPFTNKFKKYTLPTF